MKPTLGFVACLLVSGCLEKGGRPLPSPTNPFLRELQGEWEMPCESWGASSSRATMTFSRSRAVARYEYSRVTDCASQAAAIDTIMDITDVGTGEYPRPIDMRETQTLGTIYDAELLAEANARTDCGVWELGVPKDFAECKTTDGMPAASGDMVYQIFGIADQTLRFGLVEWNDDGSVVYDGSTPELRPRTLSDHEVYSRKGAQAQASVPLKTSFAGPVSHKSPAVSRFTMRLPPGNR